MALFDKAVLLINELIKIKNKENDIQLSLGKIKESTALIFKIKNYRKWIDNINKHILNKTIINKKEDIIDLKFTDKLTSHLIELFETGNIKEIDIAKEEYKKMKKDADKELTIVETKPGSKSDHKSDHKPDNKPKNTMLSDTTLVDTSKIESKPKILNGEVRPDDARGGAIFDLRYVHGIGPVNAIKLVDNGVTLEGLLSEWKEWTTKDPLNSILMQSKMSRPKQYNKTQWESLDIDKQYSILDMNFKKRLDNETKQLCKIHKSSLVGVKYFNDMSLKIPREEIKKAESILKQLATHMNKDLVLTICGSYRRGRDKSGDVDCLIAHPLIKTKADLDNSPVSLLSNFVKLLIDSNFIIDQLDMGTKKFMGFCNIMQFIKKNKLKTSETSETSETTNNIARRIDIRFVPYESYGSAILYFTGSKLFNTDMRKYALKKGYSLNEFGLTKVSDGTIIPCYTEEEIFKILNYPYKTPAERDI